MEFHKAVSNKYMSCVVLNIVNDKVKELYSKPGEEVTVSLIRCYREGEKIFEMPLCNL